jgi:hypothetical protein
MENRIVELVERIVKEADKSVIAIELDMADSFKGYYLRLYSKDFDEQGENELGVYRLEGLGNEDLETHEKIDEIITNAGFELDPKLNVYLRKDASLIDKISFIINNFGYLDDIESIDEEEINKEEIEKLPKVAEQDNDEGLDIVYDAGDKYILYWKTYYYPVPGVKHGVASGYIVIPKKYLI